ncbi:hypothetical protein VPNG_07342 [Cytospora leucostoma]|uniref:Uncharacterized protein n=1 Tax=Cytospora leucostoma TaxID=1230097 RepID=A0A423WUF5_9PEZI|nr:hypothetical protein VPNG_07342 [Cytospora leucostoma]
MNQSHSSSHPTSAAAAASAAAPPHQQGHFIQGQYMAMQSSQSQQSVALQYPPGAQFSVGVNVNGNGNGMYQHPGSPPPGHSNGQPGVVYASRQDIKGPVTSYQQVASPPAGSPPGMPSPSLMSNGQFVLPPGWKVESSQLQQPLTPRHHRPSPSISSLRQYSQQNYGIDKETGALSTRSVSPPTQSPVESRRPGQPALVQSGGHSSQNGFAPPNPPFLQQQQQQQGSSLARTSTNLTQDSQKRDENDGRRSSNMFSSIRGRLAGNGHDSRDSLGSRPQANGVTEDGVSEASIPVDEQRRTGTPNFFGGSGNGQPGSQGTPRPSPGIGGTPPPVGGAPFSPPREKRSFFTRPSGPGTRSASSQEIRRPSTAEGTTGPPIVGFGPGQPKKRFSKLTGILNREKKPSGGTFLAGIFGKRSESKTREQRPPHSPPGLGQPQGMNPQGQVMVMQRQGQPGFFLPIQGSTLGMQGQPMVPPQGQYAGLAQQVQQQQAQQQQQFLGQAGRQGVPSNQIFMQGQNPSHFGVIQQQPSPGISPITQPSGSPLATQPPGGISGQQQPTSQQQEGPQGYIPQRPQGQAPPLGVVQVATAVPIRQISSSPNGTGQLSAGSSPGGQSDSSRQKSASVVNQIDVGGVRFNSRANLYILRHEALLLRPQSNNHNNGSNSLIAAVVQSFSQQSPQSPWSIGRQGTPSQSGQPGQPGQQFSPDQSPQGMMMTPPPQEQRPEKEGAFSKLLGKSKTFVYQISEPQPSSDKPKSDKESKGVMGMLGAFKRDKTKQQQQQVEVGKAPPGGPQWNIQSGQVPPGSQQQQPGHIPQGPQTPRRLPQMQMPPKAQQVMGIGEGEQKIVSTPDEMFHPQPQSPPQPQTQPQQQSQPQPQPRSQSQPQPLPQTQGQASQGRIPAQTSPGQSQNEHQRFNSQSNFGYQKERQSPPKTTQPFTQPQSQAQAPQAVQHPGGRSSLGGAPQYEIGPSPQQKHQQQQQQPAQQSMGQNHTPTAATAAHQRAHNLKQQIASNAPEPQYAPVPIPQGYTPVYGDGTPIPRPEVIRAASYGQPYPGVPYQGPPQQWAYPGMIPGQVPQGHPPHLAQQGWPQYPPYQGTPPPMMMAQGTPPPQQYAKGQQVSSPQPIQGQAAPPQMSYQQPESQQSVHPQFVAPTNGQVQNVPHQAGFSPQSANFASPRQDPPTSFDQGQASQSNGQSVAPQVQYQYAVMSDPAHAPAQTSNGGPPQTLTPESTKSQTVQGPNQTVPRSAFAVVKPTAGQDQLQPQGPTGNLVPQRQLSGASEVSSLTSVPATGQGSTGAQSDHTVNQVQQQFDAIPEGYTVSSEPAYERPPVTLRDEGPRAETPHTATSADKDDIYGATPRQSAHATPVAPQAQHEHIIFSEAAQEPSTEPESKFAGPLPSRSPNRSPESNPTFKVEPPPQQQQQQGFVVDAPPVTVEPATPSSATTATTATTTATVAVTSKSSSPDDEEEPPSPTESELNRKNREAGGEAAAPATISGKPVQSSQEIFEEHKRRQLARDMEEKIAIFPTEPEPLVVEQQRRRRDDDVPMMSATSYPGQEWNPYGDMWVDDDV